MKALPHDLVQFFWRDLDEQTRCGILRKLEVVPANSALNFTQQRLGLLAIAEKRKITKFRTEINAALEKQS